MLGAILGISFFITVTVSIWWSDRPVSTVTVVLHPISKYDVNTCRDFKCLSLNVSQKVFMWVNLFSIIIARTNKLSSFLMKISQANFYYCYYIHHNIAIWSFSGLFRKRWLQYHPMAQIIICMEYFPSSE